MAVETFLQAPDRILTHSSLLTAGYSPQEIRKARRTGDIVPLVRGSYASGQSYEASSPENRHLQIARARAIGSPAIVVSHISAAVFHGLPVPADALAIIHVTRPGRGGSRRSSTLQQHAAVLAADDVVEEGGLRVTSVPERWSTYCARCPSKTQSSPLTSHSVLTLVCHRSSLKC